MVGHTGDLAAVEISVEATDLCIGRLIGEVQKVDGVLVVAADHGNADEMYELDKEGNVKMDAQGKPRIKTSHTLNPVPCYIYDASEKMPLMLSDQADLGISSLAATVMMCLGLEPPEDYDASIIAVDTSQNAAASV